MPPDSEEKRSAGPGKVNVLLVDDEEAGVLACEAVLRDLDQNLVIARSGREALTRVLRDDFAVILLDVRMPAMDGFEAAALIRERDRSRSTPIIFLTASTGDDAQTMKAYSLGAVDFLRKPVVPEILRSKVEVFVALARNGAALRVANEALERRTTELAAVNAELEAFSYSVSHDLRAPLRSIDGFSHLVLESCGDSLRDEGRAGLLRIRRAAQRMGELIDDLLELSRVARRELTRETVPMSELARAVADGLLPAENGRPLSVEVQEGITAKADAGLVEIVFENLLGNAFKFTRKTPSARVEVGVSNVAGHPEYFVRDNGVGFPPEQAEKLFRPFSRLNPEFPGSGIGLATVQRIVHRHGGVIGAEGRPEQGATFYFTLGP